MPKPIIPADVAISEHLDEREDWEVEAQEGRGARQVPIVLFDDRALWFDCEGAGFYE